jgi:hypothetical protein
VDGPIFSDWPEVGKCSGFTARVATDSIDLFSRDTIFLNVQKQEQHNVVLSKSGTSTCMVRTFASLRDIFFAFSGYSPACVKTEPGLQ